MPRAVAHRFVSRLSFAIRRMRRALFGTLNPAKKVAAIALSDADEGRDRFRWRRTRRALPTLALAVLGTVFSIAAWFVIADWTERSAEQQFQSLASNDALVLQSGVNEYVNKVVSLRALFASAQGQVSRSEFEVFAKDLTVGQNAIRSVAWIPHVTQGERLAHEETASEDGLTNYTIKDVGPGRSFVPAAQKADYYPLYYRQGKSGMNVIYGLDFADGGARQKTLERARDSDRLAATGLISLQGGTGVQNGFVVLLPVYRQGMPHGTVAERRLNILGFVQGAFNTDFMVQQIFGAITTPVDLYATGLGGKPVPLHVRAQKGHSSAWQPQTGVNPSVPEWSGFLKVADTQWALVAQMAPGEQRNSHMTAWIVLLAGLLLTGATAAYLWSSVRSALNLILANARISELALTDSLTGLANRRAFAERLATSFLAAGRGGSSFAVIYVDLDHFKDVNDTLGHAVGDALLIQVSSRLGAIVRNCDLVARFGGDEFALLVLDAGDAGIAQSVADRIVEGIAPSYTIDGNDVRITASVGISRFYPEIPGAPSMMMQADLALFRAKEDGRNCARFHTNELDQLIQERMMIARDLHTAIERKELELYYQPQVELSSGKIIGLEALVRWNHPIRGLISPEAFIPVAEKTGLIVAVGKWVFEEACRQTKLWNDEGIAPRVTGVNISAIECKRPQIAIEIAESLAKWKINPQQIELELTESVLMDVSQSNSETIAGLRSLGLRIAIDDFGTGYSSLSYLTAYPVDRLKIAQELVFGITTEKRNASVVRIAISLGRDLGIEVIAEGVETDSQVRFLSKAGCQFAQGYYFSKPMNAELATKLLRQASFDLTVNKEHSSKPRSITAA